MWVRSGTEVLAHTLVRRGDAGVLPMAVTRSAASALVASVAIREVAALRVFRPLVAGDLLTTSVTCLGRRDGGWTVSGRCTRGQTLVATVSMRVAPCASADRAEAGLLESFARSACLLWPHRERPRLAAARGVVFHRSAPSGGLRTVARLGPGTPSTMFCRGRTTMVGGPLVMTVDRLVLTVRRPDDVLRLGHAE
ncbi:MAG TPA: hypothetical protein VHV74_15675 [Pseudonocardiaceae bacterium]|nr:hypothetical protein [Pseudonocardiaceae bacterium]